MVFLLTEQWWGDLAGDGEGGGHRCPRQQEKSGWWAGEQYQGQVPSFESSWPSKDLELQRGS